VFENCLNDVFVFKGQREGIVSRFIPAGNSNYQLSPVRETEKRPLRGVKIQCMAMNLNEAQAELQRHAFDFFVDDPPSIAEGGNGVVVPGCRAIRI
jgi:hypothetical protein